MNKKPTFKQKLSYWIDRQVSGGTFGMIKLLAIGTVIAVVLIAVIIMACGLSEEGTFGEALWDSFATIINSWVMYSDDGGPGYVIVIAIAAVIGLLFTSILIGIISSDIEEKVTSLKHGNPVVLEDGHVVVLGFSSGSYELINQLCLAADGKKRTIVVAGDMERAEMEELIADNVDVPKKVKIICRSIDFTDENALRCCSLERCGSIIINQKEDSLVIKTMLLAGAILREYEDASPNIIACVRDSVNVEPAMTAFDDKAAVFQDHSIVGRVIAHSCTQSGIAEVFMETFSFTGSEIYIKDVVTDDRMTFLEASLRSSNDTPVGIYRDGKTIINPHYDEMVENTDKLIVFSLNSEPIVLKDKMAEVSHEGMVDNHLEKGGEKVAIIGYSNVFSLIVDELCEAGNTVYAGAYCDEAEDVIIKMKEKYEGRFNTIGDELTESELLKVAANICDHIVLLNDEDIEDEEGDSLITIRLLRLQALKKKTGKAFNITAEMKNEKNKHMMEYRDETDFIVGSDISSMIISQCIEDRRLIPAFRELLSNEGSELYLKDAKEMIKCGEYSIASLRSILLHEDCIFIGYKKTNENKIVINPSLDENVSIGEEDKLIVIEEL